ncbi:hypothetical protein BH20ACI2_BH20ACI2_28010 [soil metagenome]
MFIPLLFPENLEKIPDFSPNEKTGYHKIVITGLSFPNSNEFQAMFILLQVLPSPSLPKVWLFSKVLLCCLLYRYI